MDPVSAIVLGFVALIALGYVSRFRARSAMRLDWTIDTPLDDAELEHVIRHHLRGYWPVGRVRGSLAEGQLSRRIWRYAVNLSSEATVLVEISERQTGPHGSRTIHAGMDSAEVETMAGMAHPAWSAPLAAQRRLKALLRALQDADATPLPGQQAATSRSDPAYERAGRTHSGSEDLHGAVASDRPGQERMTQPRPRHRRVLAVLSITALAVALISVIAAGAFPATSAAKSRSRVRLVAPKAPLLQGQNAALVARSTRARRCRLRTMNPAKRLRVYGLRLPAAANVVTFALSADARRGVWRLAITCGRTSARTRLRVKGGLGRASSSLFERTSLAIRPLDHDELDASVIPAELEAVAGKDSGGPDPDFRLPFPCGEEWTASTYPEHGQATDWNARGQDAGRAVVASADGVAQPQASGQYNGGFGNYILVVHGGGWTTLYAHLSAYSVVAGQAVVRGQQIGAVGSTGNSTGPHLHFEQRLGGIRQPQRFSDGPARLASYRSDNCAPPPKPEPTPTPASSESRKVITVDNRVTNGLAMREDPAAPVRLTTDTRTYCTSRGCNINGTERGTRGMFDAAVCQTRGERTTNGNDRDPADDANPERFESTLYYGVRLSNGTYGYVSEVWIRSADRGGLGLPACAR